MPLPVYTWTLTPPSPSQATMLQHAFMKMHRASLLNMEVEMLFIDDRRVDPVQVEKLNYFIKGGGAWRASNCDHFACEKILVSVLGRGADVPCGPAGGGRWPKDVSAADVLRGRIPKNVQSRYL